MFSYLNESLFFKCTLPDLYPDLLQEPGVHGPGLQDQPELLLDPGAGAAGLKLLQDHLLAAR